MVVQNKTEDCIYTYHFGGQVVHAASRLEGEREEILGGQLSLVRWLVVTERCRRAGGTSVDGGRRPCPRAAAARAAAAATRLLSPHRHRRRATSIAQEVPQVAVPRELHHHVQRTCPVT